MKIVCIFFFFCSNQFFFFMNREKMFHQNDIKFKKKNERFFTSSPEYDTMHDLPFD